MTDYDIHPAEMADRIKELEAALKLNQDLDEISVGVVAEQAKRIEELEAQLTKWREAQHYAYIGKDGKTVLARDLEDQLDELEGKLELAEHGLQQCEAEIDNYIRQEYPGDHPVQARYRKRDFDANPARITLAALKGQDDE